MTTTGEVPALHVTLLFVCVPQETIQAALEAAADCNWAANTATFEAYMSSRRRPHFPDALKGGDGCVALIDFDANPDQAAAAATYLQQVFQNRLVVMALSGQTDPVFMLTAMRAGCTELIASPVQAQSLQKAFVRVEQHFAKRDLMPHADGSILALLGAKGGVGTTTLGVHLATYLVQNNHKRVLLIDSRAQFGHVCIYLGTDGSAFHFQEVVSNVNRLDSELLKSFVGRHASGLDLLSSPDVGQVARSMDAEDVTATLEFLRGEYDFVLVDCNDSADEISRAVISASSQVYLVATPDITAIRDLSRHVDDLIRMGDAANIQVVINRYSSQFAVSLEDIEKAIRMPVSFNIPNNYVELVRSANLGVPVAGDGKSGFTVELLKWAQSLVGAVAQEPSTTYAVPTPPRLWKSLKTFASAIVPSAPTARKRA